MNYYTGIGSRETPIEILKLFTQIGKFLANKNYILRSGGAEGADSAFEYGCVTINGKKEIYIPWKNFNNSNSDLIVSNPEAFKIAENFHPVWFKLSDGGQKLHARNVHQVLGWDLKTPSKFIICWTKKGKGQGGTGTAIKIARYYQIPILDVGRYDDINIIKSELKNFLLKHSDLTESDFVKKK